MAKNTKNNNPVEVQDDVSNSENSAENQITETSDELQIGPESETGDNTTGDSENSEENSGTKDEDKDKENNTKDEDKDKENNTDNKDSRNNQKSENNQSLAGKDEKSTGNKRENSPSVGSVVTEPAVVKARVKNGLNFYNPYTQSLITETFSEVKNSPWLMAQVKMNFVELRTLTNVPLALIGGKLVEQPEEVEG